MILSEKFATFRDHAEPDAARAPAELGNRWAAAFDLRIPRETCPILGGHRPRPRISPLAITRQRWLTTRYWRCKKPNRRMCIPGLTPKRTGVSRAAKIRPPALGRGWSASPILLWIVSGVGRRLRHGTRLGRAIAAFRHELVELSLVLGVP